MSTWNSFVCVEEAERDCVGIGGAWDKRFHCEETTDQSQSGCRDGPASNQKSRLLLTHRHTTCSETEPINHPVSTLVSGSYTKELVSSSMEFRENGNLTAARLVQWLLTSQHKQHPSELQGSAQSVSTSHLWKILLSQETHKARTVWVWETQHLVKWSRCNGKHTY